MNSRADEIRKRMAKRKRTRDPSPMKDYKQAQTKDHKQGFWAEDEERYGFDKISSFEAGPNEGNHPLFNKELFIFKLLVSFCLFLMVAILFRNENASFQSVRNMVQNTMETDFKFATVSNWYEEKFGKPLALLPFTEKDKGVKSTEDNAPQYALPASGRIIEDFAKNGQGVIIEAGKDATVEAMSEGIVLFAGLKEGFGKTVIVQHTDDSETWYGNLATIDVILHTFIEKGTKLGLATRSSDGMKSSFNLAVKKGKDFIDPSQVIRFD